jgi:hypothetical protein
MLRVVMRGCCAALMLSSVILLLVSVSPAQPGDRFARERDGGVPVMFRLSRQSLSEIDGLIRQSEQRVIRAVSGPAKPPPVNPVAPVPPGGIPIDNDSPAPGAPAGPTP